MAPTALARRRRVVLRAITKGIIRDGSTASAAPPALIIRRLEARLTCAARRGFARLLLLIVVID